TSASMSQLDPALLESSASLGAGWLYTFRRVTLPVIAPGIAAGAFLAFVASLDNVPVSLFLAGPRSDLLPIRMWGMMDSILGVRALRRGADGARRLRPGVLRRGPADEPVHCLAEPVGLARATARALAARGQGAGAARVLVAELPAARRLALARGRRALGAARWSRRLERRGVPRRTGARRHVPRG